MPLAQCLERRNFQGRRSFLCPVRRPRRTAQKYPLRGLGEFIGACNLPVGRALLGDEIERALTLVRDGKWVVVRENVRSPIDVSC